MDNHPIKKIAGISRFTKVMLTVRDGQDMNPGLRKSPPDCRMPRWNDRLFDPLASIG
jgi:hypothetical protein